MSIERPSKGILVFQCDACFDTYEFNKAEGDDIGDFFACWRVLREEGWTINNLANNSPGAKASEHFCGDCSKTAKADRDNPFRR
jgi:hypothetical protein